MNTKRLQELMDEKGINQKQLSETVGVSQAFISYVIAGQKIPSVAVMKSIANCLNSSMDELA